MTFLSLHVLGNAFQEVFLLHLPRHQGEDDQPAVPQMSFLPFLIQKLQRVFRNLSQSEQPFDASKIINGLAMTSASSLSSQGRMSSVVQCSLAWASFTEGKSSLFQTFPLASGAWDSQRVIYWSSLEQRQHLLPFAHFPTFQDGPFLSLEEVILEYDRALLDPLSLQAMSYRILLSRSLRLKSAIQKSRASCCPAPSSHSPELHHLIVLQPRLTLTYIPVQFFLVCSRSRKSPFPVGSLTTCAGKVVIRALQELPRLLVPCFIILPPAIVWVPHKDAGLWTWGFFHLSEGLIYYFFLIRRSIADTHYNSIHIRLPIPGPLQGKSCQKSIYKSPQVRKDDIFVVVST